MNASVPPHPALRELSALSEEAFAERLAGVFEHSPWLAARAWSARPFADVDALHAALLAALAAADADAQLALIRAHPELAGKEAAAGALTAESRGEQRGAGLDQCSPEELERLRRLNAAYRERHGFPFIVAVRGLGRAQIIDTLTRRLANPTDAERATALREIGKIARFRLDALLATGTEGSRHDR